MSMTKDQVSVLAGRPVFDLDGRAAGELLEAYLDTRDDHPAWGLIQHGEVLRVVPLYGAVPHEDGIRVPYSGEAIDYGPTLTETPEGVHATPDEWFSYYGLRGTVGPDPEMDVPLEQEHLARNLSGYSPDVPAAHAASYAGGHHPGAQHLRSAGMRA